MKNIPPGVRAGRGTYFAEKPTILWNKYGSKIRIGNYTAIARGCTFFLGGHHKLNRIALNLAKGRSGSFSKGDIHIGSDCWIGDGVTIFDGVTIGHGVVVGAKSVVAKSLPDYAIVVGNPCRIVRYRYPPNQVEALLKIAWWNWSRAKVAEYRKLLTSSDIEAFIGKVSRYHEELR